MVQICACASGLAYADCCESYLAGTAIAPTAEALMRSRYTAFVRGDVDYLIQTLYPDQREPHDRRLLRQSMQQTQWLKLTVLKTQRGQPQDKKGVVEFVAQYRETQAQGFDAATVHQLHERSQFVREGGQWFYVTGEHLPPVKRLNTMS
jgi:SEC-C motif domain protein